MGPSPEGVLKMKRSPSEDPPNPSGVRILNHYEILSFVFGYFVLNERKQLRDLALVCKAFLNPALDCLWVDLDSPTPLLKLHPALRIVDNSYFYLGDIDDNSASRFHEYARRVRKIHLNDGRNPRTHSISLAGFAWLGQQLRGSPLLPGLRTIRFSNPNRDSVHMGLLPLLLSPSIRTVSFEGQFLSADAFLSYALPLACRGAPALKELSLNDNTSVSGDRIWDQISTIAPKLQLRALTIAFPKSLTLKSAFLGTLGRTFDSLTSISLDVHTPSHGPSGDAMEEGLLPQLTSLHLVNRCEASLCQCYPTFLVRRATSIKFYSWTHIPDANAFSDAVEILSQCKSLKRVEIVALIYGNWHVILPSALLPFLVRLNLEEFIVDGEMLEVVAEAGGNDIQCFVDAAFGRSRQSRGWTLKTLTTPLLRLSPLDGRGNRQIGGFPPIDTLLYIARHAPGLTEVTIPIDSSVVGAAGKSLSSLISAWETPATPSTLRYLNIADRRTSEKEFTPAEYRDLAWLLDTIFPNLESVKPIDFPGGPVKLNWNSRWQLIEEHRRMRKALRTLGMRWGY